MAVVARLKSLNLVVQVGCPTNGIVSTVSNRDNFAAFTNDQWWLDPNLQGGITGGSGSWISPPNLGFTS